MMGETFFRIHQKKKKSKQVEQIDNNTYGWVWSLQVSLPFLQAFPALLSANRIFTISFRFLMWAQFNMQMSFTSNFPISVASSVSVRLCERKCPYIDCVDSGLHKHGDAHLFSFVEPFTLPLAIHTLPLNFESWKGKLGKTEEMGKYSSQFKQIKLPLNYKTEAIVWLELVSMNH